MFERESNTDLKEEYPDIDIQICTPVPNEHTTTVKNMEGKELICNEIFGILPDACYSSLGIEESSEVRKNEYNVFGSTMGFPNTSSVSIPLELKDSELRLDISLLSERSFFTQYFKRCIKNTEYLRYVSDFAFDDWNRRNIHTIVERLNIEGISVNIFAEGDIQYDHTENKIYHCVLLFKKYKECSSN